MSLKAMVWVLESSQAEGNARLVMLALADNADDAGLCWPSVPAVARKARVSDRTVQRHIRELVELGELVVTLSSGGHANRYQMVMSDGVKLSPFAAPDGDTAVTVTRSNAEPDGDTAVTVARPNGDTTVTATVTRLSPEPKELRTKNTHTGNREAEIEAWLRSEADVEWQAEHDIPDEFARPQTELWKGWLAGPTPAAKRTVAYSRSWRNWVLRAWCDLTEFKRAEWWRLERGEVAQ